jgi:hypothetical protein
VTPVHPPARVTRPSTHTAVSPTVAPDHLNPSRHITSTDQERRAMALSEYEQHVLAEMERELSPAAADGTRRTSRWRRWHSGSSRAECHIAGLLGLSLLAYGLAATDAAGTATAVCGFALTVTAANIAVSAARRRSATRRLGQLASRVLRLMPALRRYGPEPNHH